MIQDDRDLRRLIKGIGKNIRNIDPPLKGFADYLIKETQKQFDEGKTPEGEDWQPVTPARLRQKLKLGYPETPLTATGEMRKTLYANVTKDRAEVGLKSAIAAYHHEGAGNLPEREIVGVTEERLNKLRSLIKTYIRGR